MAGLYYLNGFLGLLLIALGFATSAEDVRSGKIPNRWLLAALAAGAGFAFFVRVMAFQKGASPAVLEAAELLGGEGAKTAVNATLCVLVSFILWRQKIWGGGDAKLFIVYSLLIPVAWYRWSYFQGYFPSLSLLMAIFIPAALYVFIRALAYLFAEAFRDPSGFLTWLRGEAGLSRRRTARLALAFLRVFAFCSCLSLLGPYWAASVRPGVGVRWEGLVSLATIVFYRFLSGVAQRSLLVMLALVLGAIVVFSVPGGRAVLPGGWPRIFGMSFLFAALIPLGLWLVDIHVRRSGRPGVRFATWMFLGALIVWGTRLF